MFKLRYIPVIVMLLAIIIAVPAGAQDNEKKPATITVDLEGATGSLAINHELETYANVEMVVGEQGYHLRVPVTVQIDTPALLQEAQLAAQASQQVGVFLVEPLVEGDYEKEFRSVSPSSPENMVVVFTANMTNLYDEPLDAGFTSVLETTAIDDTGNSYEEEARICDTINPGATRSCEFIFDVPPTANLVDLHIETVAHKQFSFSARAIYK